MFLLWAQKEPSEPTIGHAAWLTYLIFLPPFPVYINGIGMKILWKTFSYFFINSKGPQEPGKYFLSYLFHAGTQRWRYFNSLSHSPEVISGGLTIRVALSSF